MGATHKETVTEIVKAMIGSGIIKPKEESKDLERYILKKSLFLIEYGVRILKDPKTQDIIDRFMDTEENKNSTPQKNREMRIINDLRNVPKSQVIKQSSAATV